MMIDEAALLPLPVEYDEEDEEEELEEILEMIDVSIAFGRPCV